MRDLEREVCYKMMPFFYKSIIYFNLFFNQSTEIGCDVILGMGSSLSAGIGAGSGLI